MSAPLLVYLSGASTPDQIDRVRSWSTRLRESGIEVVSTWPDVIAHAGHANPRDASRQQRVRRSTQDLCEVLRADVLWLLCPPAGTTTRGAWVELGYAYALCRSLVASGDTRQSIFPALCVEYDTDEEAFEALREFDARRRR